MVRPKKNKMPMSRIENEILTSPCFSRLVSTMGEAEFLTFAKSKIIAIQGDLVMEGLGLSEESRSLIVNNADIFINSAASVNFNDPLKQALNINYLGAKRVLALANECKKLKIFTHVSTAYVNCDRPGGNIYEKIYNE